MTARDAHDAALLVERALDDVQECLQQGKLADLADPAEVIARLMPQMAGLSDLALAQRLRAKAVRNAACLAAATRGVRAARRRITDVTAAQNWLATYDVQGRRASVLPPDSVLQQRV